MFERCNFYDNVSRCFYNNHRISEYYTACDWNYRSSKQVSDEWVKSSQENNRLNCHRTVICCFSIFCCSSPGSLISPITERSVGYVFLPSLISQCQLLRHVCAGYVVYLTHHYHRLQMSNTQQLLIKGAGGISFSTQQSCYPLPTQGSNNWLWHKLCLHCQPSLFHLRAVAEIIWGGVAHFFFQTPPPPGYTWSQSPPTPRTCKCFN